MKLDFSKISESVKKVVLNAPVELVECVYFFVIYEACAERFAQEKMAFFPIIFFISLAANSYFNVRKRINWAYYASIITIIPVMIFDLERYVGTVSYFFGLLLSVFLVFLSMKSDDNVSFAKNITKVLMNMLLSGVITFVSFLVFAAIFGTMSYIFDFWNEWYMHIPLVLYLIVLPMTFCYFHLSKTNGDEWEMPKFVDIIINYVVCPAVIIYTAILYAYLIKITVTWNLPVGGLAAMILAFYLVALGGKLFQMVSPRKYYAWFFNNFQYISLPLMILFWVGLIYRIRMYGYTESRVYLVVAGVAMLIFSLMMMSRKLCNFKMMLIIASGLIVVFTYIPGVRAKSLACLSQESRLLSIAKKVGGYDEKTGKLLTDVLERLAESDKEEDKNNYSDILDAYLYLGHEIGRYEVVEKYGKYSKGQPNYDSYRANEDKEGKPNLRTETFRNPISAINCSEYPYYLLNAEVEEAGANVKVRIGEKVVLNESIDTAYIKKLYIQKLQPESESVFMVRNDSVMVLLSSIYYDGAVFTVDSSLSALASKPIKE